MFSTELVNCNTVLYLRVPPTSHHLLSSYGYCGHAVSHRKTRCVFFKPWESNLSQFFRIQFKVVRLEFLAPICKRGKKNVTSPLFLPEGSLPALYGSIDRIYTKAFLSWSDFVCPLLTQATYSFLPVLPPRWGGDAPGVDLMSSLTDIQLLTIKTLLASDAYWVSIRTTFQNASQAKLLGETFLSPEFLGINLSIFLITTQLILNIKLRCSFQASPHQYKTL